MANILFILCTIFVISGAYAKIPGMSHVAELMQDRNKPTMYDSTFQISEDTFTTIEPMLEKYFSVRMGYKNFQMMGC